MDYHLKDLDTIQI